MFLIDVFIVNFVFSFVIIIFSGEKKGGLCGLVVDGEVVFVGLDREKFGLGKKVEFGCKVDVFGFLDGVLFVVRIGLGEYIVVVIIRIWYD